MLIGAVLLVAASNSWDGHWHLPYGVEPPPVPVGNVMSDAKVELGRRLFYDADLSANGTLACAGCHEQKRGFADGNATRPGVHGDPGRRNVPGLANVGWMAHLTWADPRNDTLEAQALLPLLGERPIEMGMKGLEAELPRRLGADACYASMFKRAFPEQNGRIDIRTVAAALAAFQRTMIALDTPWDRFQAGATKALSPTARQGATLFASSGCAQCHYGRALSDGKFHRLAPVDARDPGLVEATGNPADAGHFRTAPLRNVAVTGPWLHDGSAKTLSDAIIRHPAPPPASAIPALIAFLEALTDQSFLTDHRFAMPDRACGKHL